MKKLLPFLKPYTKESIISPLFKLFEAGFDLLVPIVVKRMMDEGIPAGDRAQIWRLCGVLVLFALAGIACSLTAQYFAARAAVGFGAGLRSALFRQIQGFSYEQTDKAGTSTLITRMTADINQMQTGVNMTLRLLLRSPIIVFGAMILAFTVNVSCAWVFVVVIPLLAAVVFGIMLAGIPLYRRVQQNLDRVTSITRENLNGVRVIRAFRKEREETDRFEQANAAHNRIQNHVGRISALLNPVTMLIVNGGLIALLLSGAVRVEGGSMTTGDVFALTNYMSQILVELVKFADVIITVNKALACASRVESVLDMPVGMEVLDIPADPSAAGSAVCFRDAGLTYAGNAAPSVSGIDFTVRPGETVGIIGSTGSGKTSVVNLIPRFYDATEGAVLVNGRDVRSYPPGELRDRVAVVPQKAVLFRGTVRSNLLWGNGNATDEELWQALELAQAKDFIQQKPGGLDAPVSQNGRNFSGGQRQRLCIARALVRSSADILILDDSSSALDYATDAALRAALRHLPGKPTVFLISQRTASIQHADRILVLEEGRPVGLGSHAELLEGCPVYREIYESQFRKGGESA